MHTLEILVFLLYIRPSLLANIHPVVNEASHTCTTIDYKPCHFPFLVDKGGPRSFECITHKSPDSKRAWCATAVDDDGVYTEFGYCSTECASVKVHTKVTVKKGDCTTEHGDCVFPFIYKGKMYADCTVIDDSQPWCATAVDENNNYITNSFGYCKGACSKNLCMAKREDNGELAKCKIPFVFKGISYDRCITQNDPKPWCHIEMTQNEIIANPGHELWGHCTEACLHHVCKTEDDKYCRFPFKYAGKTYTDCTTEGNTLAHGKAWCSTRNSKDGSFIGEWGYCGPNCEPSVKSHRQTFGDLINNAIPDLRHVKGFFWDEGTEDSSQKPKA